MNSSTNADSVRETVRDGCDKTAKEAPMNVHPECYGTMFPDFAKIKRKERLEGKAFAALVVSSGTGTLGRHVEVKTEAWDKCVACYDYRTCYDLSLGKLLLTDIVINTLAANPWVGEGAAEAKLKEAPSL